MNRCNPSIPSPSSSNNNNNSNYWAVCRIFLARVLVVLVLLVCVVGIVLYSIDLYRHGSDKHLIGWFSSAGFVLLTIPISVRLIISHLLNWVEPNIQKYVVRIIWMVPIYSVESWLALRFKYFAVYLETLRECYEAYAIFSFLYFLFALLGDEHQIVAKLKEKPQHYGNHQWPISMVAAPWIMGHDLLQKCKFGVLQYVLIKNLLALLVSVLHYYHSYHEGSFRLDQSYIYICVINNMSQLWALYCLVVFYFACKEELAMWRPVGKFLCVKMVVFFTWWQSLLITVLTASSNSTVQHLMTERTEEHQWTNDEINKGLQDYLICIEMFVASIAFTFAFTHKDYMQFRYSQRSKRVHSDENPHLSSVYNRVERDRERDRERDEIDSDFDGDVAGGNSRDSYEAEPFLTALFQSSIPDDILSDLKRLCRGYLPSRLVGGNESEFDPYYSPLPTTEHFRDSGVPASSTAGTASSGGGRDGRAESRRDSRGHVWDRDSERSKETELKERATLLAKLGISSSKSGQQALSPRTSERVQEKVGASTDEERAEPLGRSKKDSQDDFQKGIHTGEMHAAHETQDMSMALDMDELADLDLDSSDDETCKLDPNDSGGGGSSSGSSSSDSNNSSSDDVDTSGSSKLGIPAVQNTSESLPV